MQMLIAIILVKAVLELSLMFIMGRFVLGLLAGVGKQSNFFWQLLDVVVRPVFWTVRCISPKIILDRHIPLASTICLAGGWIIVLAVKIEMCFSSVAPACRA